MVADLENADGNQPLAFRPHPWHGLDPGPREADDKIIAVLLGDPTFGELADVRQLPRAVIDRLRHYFLTYKTIPGDTAPTITVDPVYDAAEARAVISAARADYARHFPPAP